MTPPIFASYENVGEMTRSFKGERVVFLSSEQILEPIPQTELARFQRRVTIQIVQNAEMVRQLTCVIGMTQRQMTSAGVIKLDNEAEAKLQNGTESALLAVERWFQIQGWSVERAAVATPYGYNFTFGEIEFLVQDSASGIFSLIGEKSFGNFIN